MLKSVTWRWASRRSNTFRLAWSRGNPIILWASWSVIELRSTSVWKASRPPNRQRDDFSARGKSLNMCGRGTFRKKKWASLQTIRISILVYKRPKRGSAGIINQNTDSTFGKSCCMIIKDTKWAESLTVSRRNNSTSVFANWFAVISAGKIRRNVGPNLEITVKLLVPGITSNFSRTFSSAFTAQPSGTSSSRGKRPNKKQLRRSEIGCCDDVEC